MGTPIVRDEVGIRWVTLDRPETLNALVPEDLARIAEAVEKPPPEIGTIIISGVGSRSFCSGMHKRAFVGASPAEARSTISMVAECLAAVRTSPVPTIAMVHGHCLGAGFELVLACDFRVATRDTRFGLPEVRLGIPSVADAALLQHHVGLSRAKEMILTGDTYTATTLECFGLVNRFADESDLRKEALRLAAKVGSLTREVVAAQKGLFETWVNRGLEESVATSVDVFAELFEAPATVEALDRYNRDGSATPVPRPQG